jgi:hypothetical protein
VLPDWDCGSMEVNALFVSGRTIKPAARAFTDFLQRALQSSAARSARGDEMPLSTSERNLR